eukprot:126781_1
MTSKRTNSMQFHKTKNTHLIKRHPNRAQSLKLIQRNVNKPNSSQATSDHFTMIFIDCDDTLIPSKIHRYLQKNFGIDIFNLYQRTMLKQFQYDIIYAIEAIKEIFITEYAEEIKIGIVSNASSKWLNATINNKSERANFKLLSDYFTDNDIQIKSAIDETFKFLMKQFGDNEEKVNQMMALSLNADASHQSKWMLKYTTYSSIINTFRRKLQKKCRKIVNIGDGETELEAIKYYAQTFGVDYFALKFIKNATFNQLSYQWKYIKNNIWSILSDMDVDGTYDTPQLPITPESQTNAKQFRSVIIEVGSNRKKQFKHKRNLSNSSNATTESHKALNTFYFDYVLKNDNDSYFTGTHQLTAIATYFEKWMRVYVTKQKDKSQKEATLNWMCAKIHSKMRGSDPFAPHMISYKKIIKEALCKNEEFELAFENYYKDLQLRNNTHHYSQRGKSIEESKYDSSQKRVKKMNGMKQNKLQRKKGANYRKYYQVNSDGCTNSNSINTINTITITNEYNNDDMDAYADEDNSSF